VAGNWKMYKTEAQAEEYIQALLPRVAAVSGVEIGICVPFTDLRAMVDSARGSRVEVYAQNMHHEPEGAFTGEVSPAMLEEPGVRWCSGTRAPAAIGETGRGARAEAQSSLHSGSGADPVRGRARRERAGDAPSASCASRSGTTWPGCPRSASPRW
jgi:triosephosphate isomerase